MTNSEFYYLNVKTGFLKLKVLLTLFYTRSATNELTIKWALVLYTWLKILDWLIETLEAVIRSCSSEYVFLKILQISQENTCVGVLRGLQLCQKETPIQMVSCEIHKIFRNTFFYRTPPVTASDTMFWNHSMRCIFVFHEQKIIQYHISPWLSQYEINIPT